MRDHEEDHEAFNSANAATPADLSPQSRAAEAAGLDSDSVKNWKKVKLVLNASRAFRGKRGFTETSGNRLTPVKSGRSSRSNSSVSPHTQGLTFKTAAQAVLAGVRMSSTNKGKMWNNGEADVAAVRLHFNKPGGFAFDLDQLCDLMEKRTTEALEEMGGKSNALHPETGLPLLEKGLHGFLSLPTC